MNSSDQSGRYCRKKGIGGLKTKNTVNIAMFAVLFCVTYAVTTIALDMRNDLHNIAVSTSYIGEQLKAEEGDYHQQGKPQPRPYLGTVSRIRLVALPNDTETSLNDKLEILLAHLRAKGELGLPGFSGTGNSATARRSPSSVGLYRK